jgi:hypothetical protein
MRLRVIAAVAALLCACNLFARLKKKDDVDSGMTSKVEPPVPTAEEEKGDADPNALLKMLGLANEAPAVADSGCPAPVHPGYCRRSCRSLGTRKAFPHAQRIWPSTGVAFGTCGAFDVFAEREPDGGQITEYFDKSGNVIAATDNRQACGKYGSIPSCTPVLSWDAGYKPGIPGVADPE